MLTSTRMGQMILTLAVTQNSPIAGLQKNIGDSADSKMHTGGWYQWAGRPTRGLYYHPNRLSSSEDDMGSYEYGYKEKLLPGYYNDEKPIMLYLLLTHQETDGIEASDEISAAKGYSGSAHKQEALIKILLYAKSTHGGADQLIKNRAFRL